MAHSILFVDDDPKLLRSFTRTLSDRFRVVTAESPIEGLRIIREQGPFPVIVSDMKMPGMNGIELLSRSKGISPHSARILLTGFADQQTAIDAVNKGELFRFLTKPCDIDTLTSVLQDGLRQYQLIMAEKELLEETLLGTVRVLSQVLTLVNPTAQGMASRLKRYCRHIARTLHQDKDRWLYEMAAMLSQLGCLTIPQEIMTKYFANGALSDQEQALLAEHPAMAARLLLHIPRLETVAEMIAQQDKPYAEFPEYTPDTLYSSVHLGAQMLHVASGLDRQLMRGISPERVIHAMRKEQHQYNPAMVATLAAFDFGLQNMVRMIINCHELNTHMCLDEDIHTANGMLLAARGQQVTRPLMIGMQNYARSVGINEPFAVLVQLLDFGNDD